MLRTVTDVISLRAYPLAVMVKTKPRQFIREWRKHRGLTQEQLALRMGVARSYISLVEKGLRRYDQPFLEAAADALNCRPADLIMRPPGVADEIRQVFEELSQDEQRQALAVIRALRATKAA